MSHPLLKAAIRFLFITLLLILPAKVAGACTCGLRPNVLEAYEAADEVLIVRVLSVGTIEETPVVGPYIDNSRLTTGRVERVYKGSSSLNDQLVFKQGGPPGCQMTFDQDAIDKEFLFYLKRPNKPEERWHVSFCGRSNKVEFARDDLLYLDNQEKLRGKTRISGILHGIRDSKLPAAHRKIRIYGKEKTYETNTDENGVFEIYDLPPGDYRIEPEIPTGWKFFGWYPQSTTSIFGRFRPGESGRFVLEPNKHANINMMFRSDSTIAGTIVGPNANPLPDICARLWRPDQTGEQSPTACTNAKGRFLFDSVVPGTYHLVLNPSGEPTSDEPFPRLFYPGTTQREKAVLIDVGVGEKVQDVNIVVPAMLETVTIEGEMYFSNDRPARGQTVRFTPTSSNNITDFLQVYTDDKGRFTLRVLKGVTGDLVGVSYAYGGMFENCPAFDEAMRNSSQKIVAFQTPAIRIEALHNVRKLVLRFPFPKCEIKD